MCFVVAVVVGVVVIVLVVIALERFDGAWR